MEMNGSCIEGVPYSGQDRDKVLGENNGKVNIFQINETAWKGGERNQRSFSCSNGDVKSAVAGKLPMQG